MNQTADEGVDLRAYLGTLRARRWSIIISTALVIAAALVFSYWQTPTYTASSRLLLQPVSGGSSSSATGLGIGTEMELLASEPVAELVKQDLGLDQPATTLLGGLEVSAVPEAIVVQISFTSSDPQLAMEGANSFAESYVQYRRERALEDVARLRAAEREQIQEVSDQLDQVTRGLRNAQEQGNTALVESLEGERNVLFAQLGALQQEIDDVNAGQGLDGGGEIIRAARLPTAPTAPNHVRNGLVAALLGLLLGIAVAFLRERLDDRFKTRADIERDLQVPVLATIPWFGGRRSKRIASAKSALVTVTQPKSAASEAYRSLRTNLQFVALQQGLKSVLVTSAAAGEGKTATSCNLGVALAQAGKRVILVSADMRRPTLETYFDIERGDGLASWLMGDDHDLADLIVDPGIPNLRILPCGVSPANPAELLTSIKVTRLIALLEENCDLLIFDTPPVLAVADSSIIASRVGGTLFVMNTSTSGKSTVVRAKEELEKAGGVLVGSVMNAFQGDSSEYYQYGGYYGSPYADAAPSDKTSDVDAVGNRRRMKFSRRR